LARWLYSLGGINIHAEEDYAFRWACQGGHYLLVAQWLYSLGGIGIHTLDDEAFHWHVKKDVYLWLNGYIV
jgi:hypothetical protein